MLVNILFVHRMGEQPAVGPGHIPAQFRFDTHGGVGPEHPDIFLPHALADGGYIRFLFLRAVGDAHAAGQVDEPEGQAAGLFHFRAQIKQNARKPGIIGIIGGVAGQESVQAKALYAQFLEPLQPDG